MSKKLYVIYALMLITLIVDLLIAGTAVIQMFMGHNAFFVFILALLNPAIFTLVFLDPGEDVWKEEVDKRMSELWEDYKVN